MPNYKKIDVLKSFKTYTFRMLSIGPILSIVLLFSSYKHYTSFVVPDCHSMSNPAKDSLPLVFLNSKKQLSYTKYANEGESNKDNVVPDFSHRI